MEKHPVYTISNFDQPTRKSDLYVNTFSNHLKSHSFIEKPHRHNFYLLVLFTHGSGFHEIDFDRYNVRPGKLFMIQPGQIHNWQLSEDIEGYIVFYSQQVYNAYFGNKKVEDYAFYRSAKSKPELQLNEAETNQLLNYFELMFSESETAQHKSGDKLVNLIDCIHIEISRLYIPESDHATHGYNHKISQFEKLLEQHYKTEKSPSFYASKMNMTLKHLNRICKHNLGETVTDIISQRVILEARRLLSDKSKSVAQVADILGFENYPYFGKLFKKVTGISPGKFGTDA